jgi:O-antigen ligase
METSRKAALLILLAAPWFLPPQWGPSPAVGPLLLSLACAGLVLLLTPSGPSRGTVALTFGLAALAAWTWLNATLLGEFAALWIMVCAALAGHRLRHAGWAQPMADAWLLAALASSVIALCQYLGIASHFAFMSPAAPGEAFGQLRQRNQFASLATIGLAALLWRAAHTSLDQLRALKRWHWMAAVLLATASAATSSRTGALELGLLGIFAWYGYSGRTGVRALYAVALLAYVAASVTLPMMLPSDVHAPALWSRLAIEREGCGGRMTLWQNVWHLIQQRPWTGWGWGELDYAHFMTDYEGLRFCDLLDNAHNLPLHLAVELGIPTAVLLCLFLGGILLRARPWRAGGADGLLAWSVLGTILLHSLLEYPLWYGPFQLAFGLAAGTAWVGPSTPPGPSGAGHALNRRGVADLLACAALAAAAYAAWDYHRVSQLYLPPAQRAADYRENTLAKVRDSRLYRTQVEFAEFTLTPLTQDTAPYLYAMGKALLHYSPESRVVEKLADSARLLGREDEAEFYLARYRSVYPADYACWSAARQAAPR